MATSSDLYRLFLYNKLGLTQEEGARLSLDDLEMMYHAAPVAAGGGGGGVGNFSTAAQWRSPYRQSNATATVTMGTLALTPISFPFDMVLSGLAFQVMTGIEGGTTYGVLYDDNNFMPGNLVASTTGIDTSVGGTKAEEFADVALAQGHYWFGLIPLGADVSVQLATTPASMWSGVSMGTGASPSIAMGNEGYVAYASGLLSVPAVFSGAHAQHGNSPQRTHSMWLKLRKA